jgi:hypothetical protein
MDLFRQVDVVCKSQYYVVLMVRYRLEIIVPGISECSIMLSGHGCNFTTIDFSSRLVWSKARCIQHSGCAEIRGLKNSGDLEEREE